jgi:hypothetical protein
MATAATATGARLFKPGRLYHFGVTESAIPWEVKLKMRITAFCLCCFLILTAPGATAWQADATNQSWDVLRRTLISGDMRLERKDGKKFSGEIIKITETEMEINRKGKLEAFRRDEVKKVWLVTRSRKRDSYQIAGFIAGFIIGIGIFMKLGFEKCDGGCGDEKAGAYAAILGLPIIGLFIGTALAGKAKRTLIYSAP